MQLIVSIIYHTLPELAMVMRWDMVGKMLSSYYSSTFGIAHQSKAGFGEAGFCVSGRSILLKHTF